MKPSEWPSRQHACIHCGKVRRSSSAPRKCQTCARRLVRCARCDRDFWPWANGKHARKFCCPPIRRPATKVKVEPHQQQCRWCHQSFFVRGGRRYCAKPCASAAACQRTHLRRRGLRRKQDQIPLNEIYLRDRGRCLLCGDRVRVDLVSPHPRSATLDHIIPISKGGKHQRQNVQLAHYGCNSRKGARPCGSQMRLEAVS